MFRATMCPSSGENCLYAIIGTCYSVWMTVWCAGWSEITSTKCRINTAVSPDDVYIVA